MHPAAYQFVADIAGKYGPWKSVVEVGSRDINGTVRHLFDCATYVGVDVVDGPGVDVVCDSATWTPDGPVDCVVCCEVLEHAPHAVEMVVRAIGWLSPGGALIVTCAGPGREPHSAVDGGPLRPGEHYGNVPLGELAAIVDVSGCEPLEGDQVEGDTRLYAVKRG